MKAQAQEENGILQSSKAFAGMRILVCGKGGSGKSSFVSLMANALKDRGHGVVVLDGDASNPGGLSRLLFGLEKGPEPLIEFFGGREHVECPVDDPSPLKRLNDDAAVTEKNIELSEIPSEYSIQKENLILFQVGKTQKACEGCDGPMSKVNRDFVVKGDYVTLVDVEAGIEHFGRGVEQNVDMVIVVVDPTYESLAIVEKAAKLSREMGIERVCAVLNRVQSKEIESLMMNGLTDNEVGILGTIHYDTGLMKAGLTGASIRDCDAAAEVRTIVDKLEKLETDS
jgi:CO dehydrogenase maturation factor